MSDVAWEMEEGSICGLGMVAAWPLKTARQHFPDEFGHRPGRASPGRDPQETP
jgi:NADH:ubiquinone oxidoreductase subunit F (NADH-binding)